jgi:hypothetical protein
MKENVTHDLGSHAGQRSHKRLFQPSMTINRFIRFRLNTSFIFLFSIILSSIISGNSTSADVSSTTGTIFFDSEMDGIPEMTLSGNRLGIGTTQPSANLHVQGNGLITHSLIVGGSTNPSGSNLHIHGTIAHSPNTFTSGIHNLTTQSYVIADTSAGNVSLYLPSATENLGNSITIKRISTLNNLYLSGAGNLMDSYAYLRLVSGNLNSFELVSNGSHWYILGGSHLENLREEEYLHWALDNNSTGNTALDASGWLRHGTLTNHHQFSGNSFSGNLSTGLLLDEPGDAILYSSNSIPNSLGYSYAMWISANVASNATPEFPADLLGSAGFSWNSHSANLQHTAYHQLSDGSLVLAHHNATLPANTPVHLGATWNGSTLQLYVNGVASGSNTAASSWKGGSQIISTHPGTYSSGNVLYDDIRFFNRGLSSHEILILKNLGSL